MIFQNIDFHNVAEIQENKLGYRLYRFPRALCDQMGEGESRYGRYVSQTTGGLRAPVCPGGGPGHALPHVGG